MFTQRGFLEVPFTPVVDGYVFPTSLDHNFISRFVKPINLLLGVNKDEGAYFVVYSIDKFLENLHFDPAAFSESDYTVRTSCWPSASASASRSHALPAVAVPPAVRLLSCAVCVQVQYIRITAPSISRALMKILSDGTIFFTQCSVTHCGARMTLDLEYALLSV